MDKLALFMFLTLLALSVLLYTSNLKLKAENAELTHQISAYKVSQQLQAVASQTLKKKLAEAEQTLKIREAELDEILKNNREWADTELPFDFRSLCPKDGKDTVSPSDTSSGGH